MKKIAIIILVCMFYVTSAFAGQIVVATSDYETGNTALYDTKSGEFSPNILGHADNDVIVDSDGISVYFLERRNGSVTKFDPEALSKEKMVYQFSVGVDSNPHDIIFLDSKAYVIRYGSDEILIVDQNAASQESFVLGTIDISAFDANGLPEATHGFVCDGFVYVVLQRLNNWSADEPGLLLKIDSETDTIVDLDPDKEGVQGLELLVKNPQQFSQAGTMAYISGHVWGAQTEGVQSVDLSDPALPQAMILDEEKMAMDITGVKVFDEVSAIFYSSSWVKGDDGNWYQVAAAFWFNPVTGEMGNTLPVPTPDGGAVMVGLNVYVGSRDDSAPGIYAVNPSDNTIVGEPMITTLPPTSMVFAGEEEPIFVAQTGQAPDAFVLETPYPNPFNPSTTVSFTLTVPGAVNIDVFNLAGQKVESLVDYYMAAGRHSVVWNAVEQSSGVYYIRVTSNGISRSAKAMLVK